VLYYGSRTFTVIPKRVFQNAEQHAAFDQLVTQHVPVIVRKRWFCVSGLGPHFHRWRNQDFAHNPSWWCIRL